MTQARVAISEPLPAGTQVIGRVVLEEAVIGGKTAEGVQKDVLMDKDGRIHVVIGGTPVIYSTSTTGALSLATTITTNYGRPAKVKRIVISFSAAPVTSQSITATVYPYLSVSRPNALIFSRDPSVAAESVIVSTWEYGYDLALGDEVVLAFTNTDARTIKAEIEVEIL